MNQLAANQFDLTDDQREIQELARRFTADRITPHAAEWDEKHIFPRETIKAAAELGFAAIYVSEESGGIALGRLEAALIMEAMSYGCPSTSAFISIHNMAAWMIDRFGSAAVKDKYLPDLVTMDRLASYCLTEPGSGSDAAALKTRAVRDGDDWIVTGSKQFISGAGENEVYVTMVRTGEEGPKGISCLVIEKDMPGVSFGANEKKLGWHSQPTRQVIFDGVRVPAANMVGGEGEGFRIAMMGLDGGRLNIGACSLGGAQRCLDEAIAYTKDRKQFGKAIADFQNTQFMLADMATELEAARALLYIAAAKVTANAPDKTKFAAMAKRLATDTGSSVVDRVGSAELKARFLPDLVSMEKIASYCLTEPGSGSDAAALKTSARRDGDDFVLNGTKQFISGAGYNDVYVVMVRTGEEKSRGISALVVEKDTPGLSFGAPEKKLGWNASPTAQVIFEDCRVPAANLVGGEGEGFKIAMAGLDGGRLNIGACSLGGAQRCLDEAIRYTKERQQFGQPVAEFQNTQFTLADMATDLEAARALLYLAAAKVTANAPDKSRFSAMAKRLATDNGSAIVDAALQLHGGYGYLKDYPIERFWRDLRVHSILEGTNQVMRMIVGRDLLRQ